MRRSSRLRVCRVTTSWNSVNIHWQRPATRQRTTPWKVRCRSLLDPLRQRQAVPVVKDRHRAGSLAVDQANRAGGVEPQHRVANDLKPHPANADRTAVKIIAQPNPSHGKHPPFDMLNQIPDVFGIPKRVTIRALWYKRLV